MVVLRGDSTLRGHFPEVYRVASVLSELLAGHVESEFNCHNMSKYDLSRKPMLLCQC